MRLFSFLSYQHFAAWSVLLILSLFLSACGEPTAYSIQQAAGQSPESKVAAQPDYVQDLLVEIEYNGEKYFMTAKRDGVTRVMAGNQTAQYEWGDAAYSSQLNNLFAIASENMRFAIPVGPEERKIIPPRRVTVICKDAVFRLPTDPDWAPDGCDPNAVAGPALSLIKRMVADANPPSRE